jgi:hypothetical protein
VDALKHSALRVLDQSPPRPATSSSGEAN